ncbi:MAG: hypothetical protein AAAB13_01940 [Pseudomonas sp.]
MNLLQASRPDHTPASTDKGSDEIEAVHGEKLVDDAVEEELPPTRPEDVRKPAARPEAAR